MARVLKTVADAGVGVRAFCGYSMAGAGNCMIVPTDAKKAKAALKKAGYKAIESDKVVGAPSRTSAARARRSCTRR